jgi:hypothetical protein
LHDLLRLINSVYERRPSGSERTNQSECAEEQGPETLFAVRSTSSSGELRRIGNRFGSPSEPTAVTGEPSGVTQTSEGESGFRRASSSLLLRASIDMQPCGQCFRLRDNVLWTDRVSTKLRVQ